MKIAYNNGASDENFALTQLLVFNQHENFNTFRLVYEAYMFKISP